MDIHNLMEEKVIQILEEVCSEEENSDNRRYCTSEQCKVDVACFVLNRIPQRYVSSGRGFAYLEADLNDNPQIQVDMVALVHEGLRRVTAVQRSFYSQQELISQTDETPPVALYVFPTIKGRLFNGLSFEPVKDLAITIYFEGTPLPMVDSRWPNPYSVVGNTPGTYLFWPKSVAADKVGVERGFDFLLEVNDPMYEPFKHFFSIKIRSEPALAARGLIRDFSLQDLFLIPKNADNDMQINPTDPD